MVVFIALSNLQHILIDMEFWSEENIFRKLYLPIQWLILPMFFLHVNEMVDNEKPKSIVILTLFLPAGLITLLHIIHLFYFQSKSSVTAMPDFYENGLLLYTNLVSFVFNGLFIYMTYKLLKPIQSAKNLSRKLSKERRWYLKLILLIIVIITLGISIAISLTQFSVDLTWLIYTLFLLVSFVGYYMGYVGVYRSTLNRKAKKNMVSNSNHGSNTYKKINAYIIEEHRYLDMNLNLTEIATKFNISQGYLSQLINSNSQQSFNDHINSLRIEASKKMLLDQQYENYTIESIGLECGFKSKSNFYAAFKKYTGQTPKAYMKRSKKSPVS